MQIYVFFTYFYLILFHIDEFLSKFCAYTFRGKNYAPCWKLANNVECSSQGLMQSLSRSSCLVMCSTSLHLTFLLRPYGSMVVVWGRGGMERASDDFPLANTSFGLVVSTFATALALRCGCRCRVTRSSPKERRTNRQWVLLFPQRNETARGINNFKGSHSQCGRAFAAWNWPRY